MEIRNYLRSARGPQDAERAYRIVAGECERNLQSAGVELQGGFRPWREVLARAQSDPGSVTAVKTYAAALTSGATLTPDTPDAAVSTAIAMAFGYCVRALDLTDAVASLAAGWCWLELIERKVS